MTPLTAEIYQRVCGILFDEWDPIGVKSFAPRDEYDAYAAGFIRLIREGADEYTVTHRLAELARVSMGLTHVDEQRDRRVARHLIAVVRGE